MTTTGTDDRYLGRLHTASDLAATICGLRPDALDLPITAEWCAEQMHALGETRYERLTADLISAISDRVNDLA